MRGRIVCGGTVNACRRTKMAGYFLVALSAVCMSVCAAPPGQQRLYQQHSSAQLQQGYPIEYYLQNQGISDNYYRPAEQKQVAVGPNGESARLESLEPDSEVELVPGVQQPQQPPQQNPVAPNVPGLYPGQRVFIVHMPVPGYRPGTVGGYQPVYIVAAGAQSNAGFPGNGLQNAILLDPSGQAVVSPLVGYGPQSLVPPQLLGSPLTIQRPGLVYQDPGLVNGADAALQGVQQGDPRDIRFSNVVGFQVPANGIPYPGPVVALQGLAPNKKGVNVAAPAQLKQVNGETKEVTEQKSNHRGSAALQRNKA